MLAEKSEFQWSVAKVFTKRKSGLSRSICAKFLLCFSEFNVCCYYIITEWLGYCGGIGLRLFSEAKKYFPSISYEYAKVWGVIQQILDAFWWRASSFAIFSFILYIGISV